MLSDFLARAISALGAVDSSSPAGTFAWRRRTARARVVWPGPTPRFNTPSIPVQAPRGVEYSPNPLTPRPSPISLLSSASELFRFAHAGRDVEYALSETGEVGVLSAAWSTADDVAAPVKIVVDSSLCEDDSALALDSAPHHALVLRVGEGGAVFRVHPHSLRD